MSNNCKTMSVEIGAKVNGIDEAIEKAKRLKSLLDEVKEAAASLDLSLTINGKPISQTHQKDD